MDNGQTLTQKDKERYWKKKWLSDNKFNMIIGFVFSPVLVLLLRWKQVVELSTFGWVVALMLFWAIDLLHYNRRMRDYVMAHLANKNDSDHDPDDDSLYQGPGRDY